MHNFYTGSALAVPDSSLGTRPFEKGLVWRLSRLKGEWPGKIKSSRFGTAA